uniref:Uncharacterized protein AlNc14C127G6851 n=1 Tax=Albugo laibachii Nc14 TaxID=890382 RepID=F0WJY5_9STRA|nr:conserved hypothetical protein [Albugo laibachii Nc14]|eukprot:CCA21587.1 conserved hypothetical protein [Albugo laibachii Nc14]
MSQRSRTESLLHRWGLFERAHRRREADDDTCGETSISSNAQVSTDVDLPRPPVYEGVTQSHKRAIMDAYMVYDRRIRAMNMHGGDQVLRMPVSSCIDHKTLMRICKYELMMSAEEIQECEWLQYFHVAQQCDISRMTSVAEAMCGLQMVTHGDGVSRADTLVQDFLTVLDQENMEDFDEQEPQACIAFLIAALRPALLKSTIQADLKLQVNDRYKKNLPAFVAWIKLQVISFIRFEKAIANNGGEGKHGGGQRKSHYARLRGQSGGNTLRHGAASETSQSKGYSHTRSENKMALGSDRHRECLKCKSTEHGVYKCPNTTTDEAKTLWTEYRKSWPNRSVGGLTQLDSIDATACLLEEKYGGVSVQVLKDFGFSVSIISSDCVKRLGLACRVKN